MQIIIPMSGLGQRFIDSGYKAFKPLINIEGKPIIEHVADRFNHDDEYIFICNENHYNKLDLNHILKNLSPSSKVIPIKEHKLGPVHAVLEASNFINLELKTIVNYCDFSWRWDYDDFKEIVSKNKCDGCVVGYKNFHPNLLGPGLYASMMHKNNWMTEIREKYSFTKNKMDCYQSSGTYYFSSGKKMITYFQKHYESKLTINNEYYVSQVYDFMLKNNEDIFIYEIPFFLQWGTPKDLEEYLFWSEIFYKGQI